MPFQTPKDLLYNVVDTLPDPPVAISADAPALQLPQPPQFPQLPQLPQFPQLPVPTQPRGVVASKSYGMYTDDEYYDDDIGMYADDDIVYIDDPGEAALVELQESEPEYYMQAEVGGWTPRDEEVIFNDDVYDDDEVIGGWISRD